MPNELTLREKDCSKTAAHVGPPAADPTLLFYKYICILITKSEVN